MKFSLLRAAILGLAAASGVVACSSQSSEPEAAPSASTTAGDPTTQVANELRLGRNTHITSAQYTITCPGGFSKTGSIDVSRLLELEGTIPNVPVPGPCTVTLTAKSTDGNVICSGSKSGLTVTCPGTHERDEKNISLSCTRNHVGREWGDFDWRANCRSFELGAEIKLACATPDAGVDSSVDSGSDTGVDSGTPDSGPADTGTPDSGPADTGTPDSGPADTGTPDTGVDSCVPATTCPAGDNCGPVPDGCGGFIDCGTCPSGQSCGVSKPNQCGCVPTTCAALGATCGNPSNGCGGTLSCGTCTGVGQTCGGGGVANQCGCTENKTCPAGDNCGTLVDNCGNTITCGTGTCTGVGQTCGGGVNPMPNVCGCTPTTCAAAGAACGSIPDGCGGTLNCTNTCPSGDVCTGNKCVCNPVTACPAADTCGTISNGCGGTLTCGPNNGVCTGAQQACQNNTCVCIPKTQAQACGTAVCGSASDGCGNMIPCGTCPTGDSCSNGACVVNCIPKTTCPTADTCGTIDNGCGTGTLTCGPNNGVCTGAQQACQNNTCVCIPKTQAQACGTAVCGSASDGCGNTIQCGTCPTGDTCTNGACTCVSTGCPSGDTCGTIVDNCGNTISCGSACTGAQQTCQGNKCVCIPLTAAQACGSNTCGSAPDGCGNTVQCGSLAGSCPSGQSCNIPTGQTDGVCQTLNLCDPTNPATTTQTCFASRDKANSIPGTQCSSCVAANSCYDPVFQGGTCEMVTGNAVLVSGNLPDGKTCAQVFAPLSNPTERAVCLDVLGTVFTSACAASLQETPCLCGTTDVTMCLAGTATPTGAAYDEYACDFGSINGASINNVEAAFLAPTFGAGEANQLIQCAAAFGCDCF